MNHENFAYYVRGVTEASGSVPSEAQWSRIRALANMVTTTDGIAIGRPEYMPAALAQMLDRRDSPCSAKSTAPVPLPTIDGTKI